MAWQHREAGNRGRGSGTGAKAAERASEWGSSSGTSAEAGGETEGARRKGCSGDGSANRGGADGNPAKLTLWRSSGGRRDPRGGGGARAGPRSSSLLCTKWQRMP